MPSEASDHANARKRPGRQRFIRQQTAILLSNRRSARGNSGDIDTGPSDVRFRDTEISADQARSFNFGLLGTKPECGNEGWELPVLGRPNKADCRIKPTNKELGRPGASFSVLREPEHGQSSQHRKYCRSSHPSDAGSVSHCVPTR